MTSPPVCRASPPNPSTITTLLQPLLVLIPTTTHPYFNNAPNLSRTPTRPCRHNRRRNCRKNCRHNLNRRRRNPNLHARPPTTILPLNSHNHIIMFPHLQPHTFPR